VIVALRLAQAACLGARSASIWANWPFRRIECAFRPDWTFRANDRDRGPARHRDQIAQREAREDAGEHDGWGPNGSKWRQWDHLKEERRRTEIERQGSESVADLYE
jgi:hypothetical protein